MDRLVYDNNGMVQNGRAFYAHLLREGMKTSFFVILIFARRLRYTRRLTSRNLSNDQGPGGRVQDINFFWFTCACVCMCVRLFFFYHLFYPHRFET